MDGDTIQQLSVAVIATVVILKTVVEILKAARDKKNGTAAAVAEGDLKPLAIDTNRKVGKLYDQASQTDGDGQPMVYFPRSCLSAQREIVKTQAQTVTTMKEISTTQKRMADTLDKIEQKGG